MKEKDMLSENEAKELKAKENLDPSKGAINVVTLLPKETIVCEHDLYLITGVLGLEARCNKCSAGYVMTPGSELIKGHIYMHGTKLL